MYRHFLTDCCPVLSPSLLFLVRLMQWFYCNPWYRKNMYFYIHHSQIFGHEQTFPLRRTCKNVLLLLYTKHRSEEKFPGRKMKISDNFLYKTNGELLNSQIIQSCQFVLFSKLSQFIIFFIMCPIFLKFSLICFSNFSAFIQSNMISGWTCPLISVPPPPKLTQLTHVIYVCMKIHLNPKYLHYHTILCIKYGGHFEIQDGG